MPGTGTYRGTDACVDGRSVHSRLHGTRFHGQEIDGLGPFNYVASVRFGEDLRPVQSERAMMQYLNAPPERPLLAYVTTELAKWMGSIEQEESDKYVMLGCAIINALLGKVSIDGVEDLTSQLIGIKQVEEFKQRRRGLRRLVMQVKAERRE